MCALTTKNTGAVAALIVLLAWPDLSSAQVFGVVRPNGLVVLTNLPNGAREAGLKVIVAGPPAVQPDDSAGALVAGTDPDGEDDVDMSRFADVIAEASLKWNVSAALLRAVIAVESRFNPLAVSKRGARGLMQLMPKTAKRFAAGNLFDPRANVLAGAQYLRALLDLFDDNVELAVAAYNAGEQSVIKAGYRIPKNPETKAYVPAVMTRYRRLIAQL